MNNGKVIWTCAQYGNVISMDTTKFTTITVHRTTVERLRTTDEHKLSPDKLINSLIDLHENFKEDMGY